MDFSDIGIGIGMNFRLGIGIWYWYRYEFWVSESCICIGMNLGYRFISYCKNPTHEKNEGLALKMLLLVPKPTGHLVSRCRYNLHLCTPLHTTTTTIEKFKEYQIDIHWQQHNNINNNLNLVSNIAKLIFITIFIQIAQNLFYQKLLNMPN